MGGTPSNVHAQQHGLISNWTVKVSWTHSKIFWAFECNIHVDIYDVIIFQMLFQRNCHDNYLTLLSLQPNCFGGYIMLLPAVMVIPIPEGGIYHQSQSTYFTHLELCTSRKGSVPVSTCSLHVASLLSEKDLIFACRLNYQWLILLLLFEYKMPTCMNYMQLSMFLFTPSQHVQLCTCLDYHARGAKVLMTWLCIARALWRRKHVWQYLLR